MEAQCIVTEKPFHATFSKLEELTQSLQSKTSLKLSHTHLEKQIEEGQLEVSRLMLEDSIRLRGSGDEGEKITGADEIVRTHKRKTRTHFYSIFGKVGLERVGYGKPEAETLFPLDGQLNLSGDTYSLGLRRMLGNEVAKNSFEESIASVKERTHLEIPKRQAEELSQKAAVDFDRFYEDRVLSPGVQASLESQPILVLTTDGKGIVMRQEDLREATRKSAQKACATEGKKSSQKERGHAKRMAQVASLYGVGRNIRSPEQVIGRAEKSTEQLPRPVGKRVWASVEKNQAAVIEDLFSEAEARDPHHKMDWVVLVDGQLSQLQRIEAEAEMRKAKITVIIDIMHVIEYLWRAGHCFFEEKDPEKKKWVMNHLLSILRGEAKLAAAGMRRSATFRGMTKKERAPIDRCATYLHNNAPYLRYDHSLKQGHPIATGVIEGACRHLVKDRMDITGARWRLKGAEATLKLRSLHVSGDLEDYWEFHYEQEQIRNHESKYDKPAILRRNGLKLVK